jgi:hypothetical protein
MRYAVIEAPLELGVDHAILTPPVDESIEVVTVVTELGTEDAVIGVTDEKTPVPQMFFAATLN